MSLHGWSRASSDPLDQFELVAGQVASPNFSGTLWLTYVSIYSWPQLYGSLLEQTSSINLDTLLQQTGERLSIIASVETADVGTTSPSKPPIIFWQRIAAVFLRYRLLRIGSEEECLARRTSPPL